MVSVDVKHHVYWYLRGVLVKDAAECCFTSTETGGLLGTGEPRTATSTFTQLLSSDRLKHSLASYIALI